MDKSHQNLIWKVLDQQADPEEFERLQELLQTDATVQDEWLDAVALSESLKEVQRPTSPFSSNEKRTAEPLQAAAYATTADRHQSGRTKMQSGRVWIAAIVLVAVALISFQLGTRRNSDAPFNPMDVAERPTFESGDSSVERRIAGHAILRRAVGMTWPQKSHSHREGDLLSAGEINFDAGLAEIDFFCGANVLVEGPARLKIESDWAMQVLAGRLRVTVPPAARGFLVRAADSQIIDLGTEFAVDVSDQQAAVKVIDGEVRLQGGRHDGQHLTTGQQRSLLGNAQPLNEQDFRTIDDVRRRRGNAASERFTEWKAFSATESQHSAMIAYFPIGAQQADRKVLNAAASGAAFDGLVIGPVEAVSGRFGQRSRGLAFGRPGARVRTRIDGEFQAFTFACWVRIDSLEHRYNALFMGDGYENGEPHWQIRDDGRLMFSVMVDDSQDIRHFNEIDQQVVRDAGLHRVYMTDPIWDLSNSGQWFHLAAVYDPEDRRVQQFVNGRQVSEEKIVDRFYIDRLKIGPAEIGNWGQPFRKTPWFAVRNLNGIIDELAIYNAALTEADILTLYSAGRPPGY